ncbi:unnamed protein product [Natator depressus]
MTSCNPSSRSGSTQGTGIQTGQQGPGAQPEPGRPVQLVRLDEEGDLTLDKEALSRCLEQGGVGDAPVCLVSIIGEQRRGKSFLLNCLLRQLQSPEAVDASWMDREDEVLGGFECCNGIETVTKGVWMWDQPLWVQDQGRRVAVFLVDTEGCLDLQRPMETSIKLSVFSILLSSYWIFNISSTFTRTEADYLEMFIQVANEVGETCNLAPIQHLDLLVRDWQLSGAYGADGGQDYLRDTTQKLEASAQQPLVVGALTESGTRCYLLPHPGTEFIRSGAGMPGNMDKYFRHYLRDYLSTVECSAGTHARTDQARRGLTGAQLAARIKGVSQYLKTKRYNFSSPVKMAEVFAAMREEINSRAVEATRQEYEQFVQEQDRDHQSRSSCLNVEPAEMQHRLEGKRQELLESCRGKLRGKDPEKQAALEELKQGLDRLMAQFLPGYEQRFKRAQMAEMREKANRKAVEDTRREYEQFREKQDRDHQTMSSCLSVKPLEMRHRLEGKRQELLERCRGELQGEDPQKQAVLEELKQELDRLMAQFLSDYKLRFKMAEMSVIIQEVNRRAVEATRREFQQFVKQLDRDHQSMSRCLRVKPLEMRHHLERKRQELQEHSRGELLGEDPQKQAALEELKQGLDEQTTPFLSTYGERFKRAVMEANSRAVEAARQEYEQFVQKQDRDHQSSSSCLNVEPAKMQQRLEEKRQELQERCWGELRGEDPQKQAALKGLEHDLDKQTTQFLSTYGERFERAVMEANSRAVEAARQEYEQFVQKQDRDHQSRSSCLNVEPAEMQHRLEEKYQELQERCWGELRGEDPQKQAAQKGLEHDLDKQTTQFLSTYGERFKVKKVHLRAVMEANSRAVQAARTEYEQFVQKQDRDHHSMSRCLRVEPQEMQHRLEGKRQELLERCRAELWGEEPQKRAALEELKQGLDEQTTQFLSTYGERFERAVMEANSRAVEAARQEYEQFREKQDRDHQSTSSCLSVEPAEMQDRLEGKRRELQERCRGELWGEDPQKQAALEELKQGLDEQTTQFLSTYGGRFERAVMEANSRAVEAARQEYEQFREKQDRDHQSTSSCLSVEPAEMQDRLEGKRRELQERCRGELWGEDPQKQAALEELKQGLDEQTTQFLSTYGGRFKRAVMEANSRAVEAARQEYEQFVQKQDRDHQSSSSCLNVEPAKMQQRLEEKRQELQERCWGELRGEDPQKQAALKGLEHDLDKQTTQFLSTYGERFERAVMEANSRAVEAARQEYEQFVQKQDRDHQSRSSCLNVEPAEMQHRLEEKYQELQERCWGELRGEDPQKQAAQKGLEHDLDKQTTQFLSTYGERFKRAVMEANSRAVEAARQEYEQFVQKQDRDHQSTSSCLSVGPAEMQHRLERERQELLERCRGELRGEDPQKQAALEELEHDLDKQTTQFLSTYGERFERAVMEANSRAVQAARTEYEQFVQKQDRDHHSMSRCLRVEPQEMQHRLEGKRQELLERCRAELWGEEPQKRAALEELKQGLDEQTTQFLSTYGERFERAVMEANSRAVKAARQEYEQFVQEQDRDHQSTSSCLRVKPLEMRHRLERKRQELQERCRGKLRGEDPQKQAALEELEQGLDKQTTQFLSTYGERFERAEMEANSRAVQAARTEYEQFVQEQDRDHQSMRHCLRVKPAEMQECLNEKRQELQARCRGELRGEDPQKQAALDELEHDLDEQTTQFLSTYGERFKKKTILKGACIVGGGLAAAGAVAGAGIGVGVAAGVLAVGEVVAIAVGAGGGGLIVGGVGAWLEQKFGRNKRGSNTAGQQDEGEGGAGSSDREPLLPGGT